MAIWDIKKFYSNTKGDGLTSIADMLNYNFARLRNCMNVLDKILEQYDSESNQISEMALITVTAPDNINSNFATLKTAHNSLLERLNVIQSNTGGSSVSGEISSLVEFDTGTMTASDLNSNFESFVVPAMFVAIYATTTSLNEAAGNPAPKPYLNGLYLFPPEGTGAVGNYDRNTALTGDYSTGLSAVFYGVKNSDRSVLQKFNGSGSLLQEIDLVSNIVKLTSDSTYIYFYSNSALHKYQCSDLSLVTSVASAFISDIFTDGTHVFIAESSGYLRKYQCSDLSLVASSTFSGSTFRNICLLGNYVHVGYAPSGGTKYLFNKSDLSFYKSVATSGGAGPMDTDGSNIYAIGSIYGGNDEIWKWDTEFTNPSYIDTSSVYNDICTDNTYVYKNLYPYKTVRYHNCSDLVYVGDITLDNSVQYLIANPTT